MIPITLEDAPIVDLATGERRRVLRWEPTARIEGREAGDADGDAGGAAATGDLRAEPWPDDVHGANVRTADGVHEVRDRRRRCPAELAGTGAGS